MITATYSNAPEVVATPVRCLPVLVKGLYRQIPLHLIVRIEAFGPCCRIYTRDGGLYGVTKNLTRVGGLVGSFWRVHRGHLVNPAYVKNAPGSVRHGGRLPLTTGEWVPVARRRKDDVCRLLRRLPIR